MPSNPANDESETSRTDIFVLLMVFGTVAIFAGGFIYHWFKVRDTWAVDNYSKVIDHCDAVQRAIGRSDDDSAAIAYRELTDFIKDRKLSIDTLVDRVHSVETAYAPGSARLERKRQKQLLAEKAEIEANEKAARLAQEARARDEEGRRPKEKYYRDTNGKVVSESEIEFKLSELHYKISTIIDPRVRSQYEDLLQIVESEWAKMKRAGPIYERRPAQSFRSITRQNDHRSLIVVGTAYPTRSFR